MLSVPWKVRASSAAVVLIAGGSLGWMARPAHSAVSPARALSTTLTSSEVAGPARTPAELTHQTEPGPPPHDTMASGVPPGLTVDGSTQRRTILFTFDDGPSRRTTPRLLDTLDRLGIRAVFFLTTESFGSGNPWEREHEDIVREIADRGHTIGNHTETHRQLPLLRNAEIEAELSLSERKIRNAIGLQPRLIRPPGGALSTRVSDLLGQHGYTSVLWTVYTGDLEVDTAEDVERTFFRVLRRRERETGDRGGIVLLHDTQPHSLEAVPRLVDALRRRNCELLEEGEELYDVVGDIDYFIPGREPADSLDARQARLRETTRRHCHALASR